MSNFDEEFCPSCGSDKLHLARDAYNILSVFCDNCGFNEEIEDYIRMSEAC